MLWLSWAWFRASAALINSTVAVLLGMHWSQGRIPESQRRKLLRVVSRGLGVADLACSVLERQRLGCGADGKGFPVLARSPRGAGPSTFSSS